MYTKWLPDQVVVRNKKLNALSIPPKEKELLYVF